MDISEKLESLAGHLSHLIFAIGTDFNLPSLTVAFCVAIGFLAGRQFRRRGRMSLPVIRRAVFRRRFLVDRSVHADVGFFFLNTLAVGGLIGWGMFGAGAVSNALVDSLTGAFGPRAAVDWPEWGIRAGVTLALFLAYELGYWLDHFLKHRFPFLWETHKPHHSAQMLTPWTVWRVHPLDTLIFSNILALTIGAVGGFLTYGLGRKTEIFAVDGANILLVFFIYAYVHLQHSQFWIPFTGALGRIFMSPAHHQIHHSIDPRHHNRNFGSCLSLFDWLFGTLELPSAESPRLTFGVEQTSEDPHSITTLLATPAIASVSRLVTDVCGAISAGLAALPRAGRVQPR
jgi:sterol desaturase/sphingolipid hydroxylase (fatty acid hydroxylase superfamily)